ncbi:MAG: alpha/beta hydrolase, partial [Mycobacteriaceae bacterium]|nr:alpha/beta hydrolase [Mycobacteriaceae bacterium]
MAVNLRGVTTVLLPGTGSDDDYLRRAFGAPLRRAGATLIAVAPRPQHLVAGYLA